MKKLLGKITVLCGVLINYTIAVFAFIEIGVAQGVILWIIASVLSAMTLYSAFK